MSDFWKRVDEELEYLHSQGKVLDWWYYQKSKKPIWMKWAEQTDKFYKEVEERKNQELQEQELQNQVETQVKEAVENLLADLVDNLM